MKKVIRLTESDLIRLVKKVIREGEEHEKIFNDLIDQGEDHMSAYYKAQLLGGTKLSELFNMYGEVLGTDLYGDDPNKFAKDIVDIVKGTSKYPLDDDGFRGDTLMRIFTEIFKLEETEAGLFIVEKIFGELVDDNLDELRSFLGVSV